MTIETPENADEADLNPNDVFDTYVCGSNGSWEEAARIAGATTPRSVAAKVRALQKLNGLNEPLAVHQEIRLRPVE